MSCRRAVEVAALDRISPLASSIPPPTALDLLMMIVLLVLLTLEEIEKSTWSLSHETEKRETD